MPQNPLAATFAINPSNQQTPVQADGQKALIVGKGLKSTLNITAATVVKAAPGRACKLSVIVAGSAAGTVNDVLTTGAAAAANQIAVAPNTVGTIDLDWPCAVGIVVVPGTGQTLALSWI